MLIGLLYDAPSLIALGSDVEAVAAEGSVIQVDAVEQALGRLGHRTARFVYRGVVPELIDELDRARPAIVFNLVQGRDCARIAGLLDLLGVDYTGAGPRGIELTTDKVLTKDVLAANGVGVPGYAALAGDAAAVPTGVTLPAIVKLRFGDNSVGLDRGSVVASGAALAARARELRTRYQEPLIVEEYVDGREISVALLGNPPDLELLPLRETDFSGYPDGTPRIMSYAAKWLEESVEFNRLETRCPAHVGAELRGRLEAQALRAFAAVGCRDDARVDFRVDRAGRPRAIEVNTNPDIQLEGGFTTSALESGRSYDQIVDDLLACALRRVGAAALQR